MACSGRTATAKAHHPGVASSQSIAGKRDTQIGINTGSPVFLLDDPDGNTWCMKSASRIVDPNQTYESLKDLGGRLKPAPGWRFRTRVLAYDTRQRRTKLGGVAS